jgi:hypothetical protein
MLLKGIKKVIGLMKREGSRKFENQEKINKTGKIMYDRLKRGRRQMKEKGKRSKIVNLFTS